MRQVKCKSGIKGWRDRLQNVYTDYAEWSAFAEMNGLHTRLGYETPEDAWADNPMIEGSTNPSDYRKVN